MRSKVPAFPVSEHRRRLTDTRTWARAPRTPQRVATRARIIPLLNDGASNRRIAIEVSIRGPTAILWRERISVGGSLPLPRVEAGRGRKPTNPAARVKRIVDATKNRTGRRDPLLLQRDGQGGQRLVGRAPADLECAWIAASPRRDAQALPRPRGRCVFRP